MLSFPEVPSHRHRLELQLGVGHRLEPNDPKDGLLECWFFPRGGINNYRQGGGVWFVVEKCAGREKTLKIARLEWQSTVGHGRGPLCL
jgi:hypothetical protein